MFPVRWDISNISIIIHTLCNCEQVSVSVMNNNFQSSNKYFIVYSDVTFTVDALHFWQCMCLYYRTMLEERLSQCLRQRYIHITHTQQTQAHSNASYHWISVCVQWCYDAWLTSFYQMCNILYICFILFEQRLKPADRRFWRVYNCVFLKH